MNIILTHEQADFDALASLLGAYLINDTAIPVLPRRLNRNVRAFLTLYGMDLPFIDPRDLPGGPVENVILVDTQSIVSIKGMGSYTRVKVIDHHPLRGGLPDNWNVITVETGATTTLLVEELREQNGMLSTIEATLLLIGIYEDTGSLTYARTTSRDLTAAAYLIDQGASLQVVNNFINLPLSIEQQKLYDDLREKAVSQNIHGYSILISCGDASNIDEELSSIAHKLRDLLDPDALFLLITTRSGVQLIARSTNDVIDVCSIAAEFDGGGHQRAAAALIKDWVVEDVYDKLIQLLQDQIPPPVTVAQIMSRDPQLFSPDTSAQEALTRMSRYGYEGFPVVENGEIIGLLTRRAVDRALAHKMNITAASLMDAGNNFVTPDDSIDALQKKMTASGWGQIPVVDPESKEIIGIVTRTDLIKTITGQRKVPGIQNLASKLERVIPPPRLSILKTIAAEALSQQSAIFIVGGFVRDLLLGHPSQDFDIVVEGDAIKLAKSLLKNHGGRVTNHTRFGTAKWYINPEITHVSINAEVQNPKNGGLQSFDFVSARSEFYTHPTALPTVERGSIKLDLHRRDFTINTLALRLDGRHYGDLYDYWGGLEDLKNGVIRVLHSLSFVDDPTRILRAVRFEQRFGFIIEQRTSDLLKEAVPMLDRLSGDRIRHEIDHILVEENVANIMRRLADLELLQAIDDSLIWDAWLAERFEQLQKMNFFTEWDIDSSKTVDEIKRDLAYTIWMIRIELPVVERVIHRLRLPVNLEQVIINSNRLWQERDLFESVPASMVVKKLDPVPAESILAFYLAVEEIAIKDVLENYLKSWKYVFPHINGNVLRQKGLPPGPQYRQILTALRDGWLDGKINSAEAEAIYLDSLLGDTNLTHKRD